MKKKGELTTQQLVTIIILILSFVVVLFLLFRLDLGETTKKEICHNSVITKTKSLTKSESVLDCKTTYVCIGDECENFNYDVSINVKTEEEIVEAIKNEIKDCDWMFGEGKLNYGGFWDFEGLHCAICSTIKFGEDVQNKFPIVNFNGIPISTNVKFSVVVGINPEVGVDTFVSSKVVQTNDIESTGCDKYISKA